MKRITVLVLILFSFLLLPNAYSYNYDPLAFDGVSNYNFSSDYQYQWEKQQFQQFQRLLREQQREIEMMKWIIGIIAPPEFLQILEPALDDLLGRIQKQLESSPSPNLFQTPQQPQNPQTSYVPQNPRTSYVPQNPSSPKSGLVKIAVVDIFGDPNNLDNIDSHGNIVTNTIRDSMPAGVDYEITKINLCDYREHTGAHPIYTEDGNVVIDGIIYHDYRNLSSHGFQHDYRQIGVVISAYGLTRALEAAKAQGADVINMSNGVSDSMGNALRDEFASLRNAGIVVVAAAGNEGKYGASCPARYSEELDNVIGVGAPAQYSNYGHGVTLKANGNYGGYQGTSFAAPRVTAAVAILLSRGILPENIRSEILALCNGGYLSDSVIASLGRDTSSYITRRSPSLLSPRESIGAGGGL